MKLPRNLSGKVLARKLRGLGFEEVHQTGSHIICRTAEGGGHTEVIPDHKPLKVGTLASILNRIARHLGKSRDELMNELKL
ncbi:type II toxin-antitoxin system HicA family toxin [bacterium]|nr:type II toxin-antitoxin system HicA family toxin [bacterium]